PAVLSPRLAFFFNQPVPINQAVIQDLTLLPGIGEQLARRIIAFRDKNGGINDRSDLEQIPGIGRKLSRKFSGFVTFSQP
ncbi:MAG: helix-hairpin-helix domain-containing protein, partial [Desulfobulbaceae bacterium]|nr:helix-hairpin-helix domain-containing protein [Desulfobulbaceae bacterium]